MLRHIYRSLLVVLALLVAGCSGPPPPVLVEGGTVTVHNQTDQDWKNVLVTVNDHFRGGANELKAGGRMNAPLSQLTTGLGQKWTQGTGVRKVHVKAEKPDGTALELTWDPTLQR